MIRLIVFDLDGTLVDSRHDIARAANALLESSGAAALPEETIGRMVGDGAGTLVARAFAGAGRPAPPDALDRFMMLYDERLLDYTRPYPHIPEVLAALGRRAALAVLTNKPLAATRRVLDGLDLARHFPADRVVGGDGPLPRKPDPAGLRHLAEVTGAPPAEVVLVGDSAIDWRTSRAAGARVCLARYGFGFESVPVDEMSPGEWVADSPLDLLRIL